MALNWFRFERNRYSLSKVIITVAIILLLNVAVLSSDKSVDNYAHGGGFLMGIFLSMTLGDIEEDQAGHPTIAYEKRVKMLGILLAFMFSAGSGIYLYLLK